QAELIKKPLIDKGYVVDVVLDGEQGWAYVEAFSYDLLLINASLPRIDGIQLCQRIREKGYIVPILLLTVEDDNIDQVACLEAKADDLLVRPSTRRELFARIRALLHSPPKADAAPLTWQGLCLDPVSRNVTYNQQPLSLSAKEYGLLELFLRNPKQVLTQATILEHLWSFENKPYENTVRAHIKRLRQKLRTVDADHLIETVYGFGYRLKPLPENSPEPNLNNPTTLKPEQSSKIVSVNSAVEPSLTPADWLNSSERLKTQISERVQTLEQAIATAQTFAFSPSICKEAEIQAHKLAGSLGVFGLKSAYQLAQQIEQWFISTRQSPQTSISSESLNSLLSQLHQELQQSFQSLGDKTSAVDPLLLSKSPVVASQPSGYRVLVVDDDRELTQQLQQVALNWNIQLDITTTLEQARAALSENTPDLVLLDLIFRDRQDGGYILLEELKHQFPKIPVLVWTVRDRTSDRATVSRLGGKAFLSKSVSCSQVLETIKNILQSPSSPAIKVLAVDDDEMTLNFLQGLLPSYGIEVTPLVDSRSFWKTLEETVPDLLILDWEMPHFNGIELCKTVRADRVWNTLPIVFLSASQDPQTIQRMYQAGADDYVSKPFAEAELVTRIFNRIERIHLLRSLAETDLITGLANRRRSSSDLSRYLHLCQRQSQSFCLALISLDHIQSIRNQYGYEVGEYLMRQFGKILQYQFRDEDIVAYWGNDEFLIGLYASNQADSQKRISTLITLVEKTVFPVKNYVQIQMTASAGISLYPKDGLDLSSLYTASNAALNRAISMGGNCCLTTAY
ncbi:MAG: response regulator, partial [Cyanobacteriota bacterium]|nr:response regulator [Cyanobacteriota bacterium]